MSLIALLLILTLIGLLAWSITTFVPMPSNIRTLIIVVCGIVAILYVLSAFGIIGSLSAVRVPTVK